ncbi:phage holin family protein [Arsukibacterium sp.]|uniref:phage holin family protein n=1 Tax=Arsukibacterium sp. TaxID=1977258 RepID=UPI002FD8C8A4
MPDGTTSALRQLIEIGVGWIWFIVLAIWGGTANYISRIRKNNMKFSTVELIGEWTISGFAGVVTGLLCMEYGMGMNMTFAMVAIAGHAGGRAIFLLENLYAKRIDKKGD